MKMLPELQAEITGAETPMGLWVEIPYYFDEAYEEPRNESLIERIYQYADWCLEQDEGETAEEHLPTCVVTCFWGHIPTCKAARDDMPRWFSFEEFMANKHFFEYLLTEEECEGLKEVYSGKEHY